MSLNPAPDPMIVLSDVHLTLTSAAGPVKILKGVDLAIGLGQSVSIVGPSGSGKSTLLSVVGGIERPNRGHIVVDGQRLDDLDEDQLAAFRGDRIGIIFQSFHLLPTMTALENVAIPLELAGVEDAFDRAEDGLVAVGLSDRGSHYPGQLSGGEQQRVALARALANEPKVLLADEPTGNLDQITGAEIVELMFGIQRERGATLLLITHEMRLAERCDRGYAMANGVLKPAFAPMSEAQAGRSDEVA